MVAKVIRPAKPNSPWTISPDYDPASFLDYADNQPAHEEPETARYIHANSREAPMAEKTPKKKPAPKKKIEPKKAKPKAEPKKAKKVKAEVEEKPAKRTERRRGRLTKEQEAAREETKKRNLKRQEKKRAEAPDVEIIDQPEQLRPMNMRIEPSIIEFFKRGGRGYQTRIRNVLREFMESHGGMEAAAA